MARVIKSQYVNLADSHIIEVPKTETFNAFHQSYGDYDGDETDGEFGEQHNFVDPEELIRNAEIAAQEITANAHVQVQEMLEKAREEAEQAAVQIHEDAKEEGYNTGYREATIEAEKMKLEAQKIVIQAKEEREELLKSLEPEIVSFVVETTEKLLGSIITLNPEVILYIIKVGLEGVQEAKELNVRVSKDDYDAAMTMKEDIQNLVDSDTALTIIKDTGLSKGDCVIDTPIGSIDCSVATQWKKLKNDILHLMSI